jgi:uracil-DNA glycosylase family 4
MPSKNPQTPSSITTDSLDAVAADIIGSRKCERLVEWRERVAREKTARFRDWEYWGRPVPPFGDPNAKLVIVGLAPAAHGGNRTGRIFTGDESGNFLFRALHAVGLSNQPESIRPGDGLALSGALLTAAVKCAPPDNRPLPEEFANCREYLVREVSLIRRPRVLVALGGLAFESCLVVLARLGLPRPRPKPRFAHGARYEIGQDVLYATYHPSQQNTFTGRLTQAMLRAVLRRAAREAIRG